MFIPISNLNPQMEICNSSSRDQSVTIGIRAVDPSAARVDTFTVKTTEYEAFVDGCFLIGAGPQILLELPKDKDELEFYALAFLERIVQTNSIDDYFDEFQIVRAQLEGAASYLCEVLDESFFLNFFIAGLKEESRSYVQWLIPETVHDAKIYAKYPRAKPLTKRQEEKGSEDSGSSSKNANEHWIKDEKYSTKVKDEQGYPSFALINKATGEAIKHSIGATHPVQLIPYKPDVLDESVLWTMSKDLGDGFRTIRMINNIRLNVDAFNGDQNHGGVHDGTTIVLWEWKKGDNQRWNMVPY